MSLRVTRLTKSQLNNQKKPEERTPSCSVYGFKHTLDSHLMNIVNHPCVPGFNNSLDGGDCIKWRTLCDDLAAAELPEVLNGRHFVMTWLPTRCFYTNKSKGIFVGRYTKHDILTYQIEIQYFQKNNTWDCAFPILVLYINNF